MSETLFDISDGTAAISPCGTYRYTLTREVNPRGIGAVVFAMLNPSTADASKPDPTLTRCMRFARDWGYRQLVLVNLFAYRSSSPKVMKAAADPVGPENNSHILEQVAGADLVVAGWGTHGGFRGRDKEVVAMLGGRCVRLSVLAITKDGHPQHPLFVRADVKPMLWEIARA